MQGPADWSQLIFIGGIVIAIFGVAVAAVLAAWSVRGAIETSKNELKGMITAFDKIAGEAREADRQSSQLWREGLGERLIEIRDELNKAIADSRHDLRAELNARMLMLETGVDKLNLEFVEHRTEDRGYFENLQMRVARLEPQPPLTPARLKR